MAGKAFKVPTGSTPSESSPSAQAIASSVNLLTEILLLLPAESLVRFKAVSKYWLSLISDSRLCSDQSSQNPGPKISGLYFYKRNNRLHSLSLHGRHHNLPSLAFLDGLQGNDPKPRILNSCNGLLLCETGSKHEPIYIVCNATAHKCKVVPKPSGFSSRSANHCRDYLSC